MTNTWGNNGNSDRLYFLGLQIAPVDSYYSHKIKTLVAWKKSYDTLRQRIIKKRHHFIDKFHTVKVMVFPIVMYGCESCIIKNADC